MRAEHRRRHRNSGILVCILGICIASSVGCRRESTAGKPERVRLCLGLQPWSALVFVALEKGFFDEQGLQVDVERHVSGKRALNALLEGDGDYATSADAPIVFRSFERPDLRIVAQIAATGDAGSIVARRDHGISQPADLRGKRIATQRASAVHFFLHMFLISNGLSEDDVTLSFLPAESLPPALEEGTIDAFSMREPYIGEACNRLGDKAVVFEAPGIYFRTEHLVTLESTLTRSPETTRRLIKALLEAERFARENPAETIDIVAHTIGAPAEAFSDSWRGGRLAVTLDQATMTGLEDEARWAVENELVGSRTIPNFVTIMYLDGLKDVRPSRVTVIH